MIVAILEHREPTAGAVVGLLICVLFLLAWLLRVNERWVREAAFDYARQLLESIELLRAEPKAARAT